MISKNNITENIIIYDLDGTLIPFNSFKYWLIYSFFLAPFFLRIDYNFLIFSCSIRRLIRRIDRVSFKEKVMIFHENNQNGKFYQFCNSSFATFLKSKTRRNLLQIDKKMFLVTAAPDCYVKYYVNKWNCFDNYLASIIKNNKLKENFYEKKWKSISQILGEKINQAVLYTDHSDDIPLAKQVSQVFLVNPTDETKQKYERAKIIFTIIK